MSLIDASSGYHSLKLDNKSSQLNMFAYQFLAGTDKMVSIAAAPCRQHVPAIDRWDLQWAFQCVWDCW